MLKLKGLRWLQKAAKIRRNAGLREEKIEDLGNKLRLKEKMASFMLNIKYFYPSRISIARFG